MNRLLAAVACVAVAICCPSAPDALAAKKPVQTTRSVVYAYQAATNVSVAGNTAGRCGIISNCTTVVADPWEFKMVLSVKDDNGQPVGLQAGVKGVYSGTMCGGGTFTFPRGGSSVDVRVVLDPACRGVPTTGRFVMKLYGQH